jgi:hypothetical protein
MDEQSVGHTTAPAGWFADQTGTMRWWDGVAWTEHTAPGGTVPASDPTGTHHHGRPGVNTFAVVALLVGFVPYFGVLAILAGITALDRIKQTGERGRIPAFIGITFGSLWGLDLLLLIFNAVTT